MRIPIVLDALGVIPSSAPATQLMEILKGAVGRQVRTGKTSKYRKTRKYRKDEKVQGRQESIGKTKVQGIQVTGVETV